MNILDYRKLYFDGEGDPEENTNVSTDFEPAISIDHINRIIENINTLARALGITNMMPHSGELVKRYKTTVVIGEKQPEEGAIVPLSKVKREALTPLTLKLEPYRKLTTAQALNRVGTQIALNDSDEALVREIRKDVRDAFFDLINDDTDSTEAAGGATLQAAIAQAWGSLVEYFEDKDVTPVFFINPIDVATYLGQAQISTQTAFGFQYVENFLGLGNAFITPQVAQGEVRATVTENLNGVYVPQGGDVADAFDMTYDESGIVGMTHSRADDRASIQTLIMLGVLFYPEDASGVIVSKIA